MDLIKLEGLLKTFKKLPKEIEEPTFLELCRYPNRRFEEICSRLLCFYLNPYEQHGMKDLFIKALIKIIGPEIGLCYSKDSLMIFEEENAEGKRIDIVIEGENFVIGVENKIDAPLYNDLAIYSKALSDRNKSCCCKIVLSLREIRDKSHLQKMKETGFKNATYKQLFIEIKNSLGIYAAKSNSRYLTYALDFIKTIENMEHNNFTGNEMTDFFFTNTLTLNELTLQYANYQKKLLNIKLEQARLLVKLLKEETGDLGWRTYEDEGCSSVLYIQNNFGIESWFIHNKENPLFEFVVKITTWDKTALKNYGHEASKEWSTLVRDSERSWKHYFKLPSIYHYDKDSIIQLLKECFYKVIAICRLYESQNSIALIPVDENTTDVLESL